MPRGRATVARCGASGWCWRCSSGARALRPRPRGTAPPRADGRRGQGSWSGGGGPGAAGAGRRAPGDGRKRPRLPACERAGTQRAPATQGRCNTPERTARFARCRAARDADACRAAGGTWGRQGTATVPACACPTGQGGCPCRREGDCLAGCRAPMALNASRENRCRAMWSSCAPTWPSLGCWCWFGADGQLVERCSN